MEQETLRHLIRRKLADGRLPQNSIPRLWGGAGNGETCDACEERASPRRSLSWKGSARREAKAFSFTLDASTSGTRSVACLAEVTPAQMNFQRTVPVSDGSLDRQWTMS
jgi:hypothetical protein